MNAHTAFKTETSFEVYVPSKRLSTRIVRRLTKYTAQRSFNIKTERPLISFSFDDCPQSVVKHALPALEKRGWRGTIYAAMGLCETTNHLGLHMSEAEIKTAYLAGHEIGNHTYTHIDARAVSIQAYLMDIAKTEARLAALDIPKARTFAYPYGELTLQSKRVLSNHFDLMRGIYPIGNGMHMDLNQAASERLYSGEEFETCLKTISGLEQHPKWINIFTHDVRENPSEFGCTPAEFEQVLEAAHAVNAEVLPLSDALDRMREYGS